MDLSILGLGLSLIFPTALFHMDYDLNQDWSCDPLVWTKPPVLDAKNILSAEVSAQCEFVGHSGGGFPELRVYLNERIVKEAQKIHQGPTDVTYQGLPGVKYDVSVAFGNEDNEATVRQDAFISTDDRSTLHFSTFSTQIRGSGMAEYLRKVDIETVTQSTAKERTYDLGLVARFKVEKPWIIPKDTFISQVKSQIESRATEVEQKLIEDISQHIY